MAVSVPAGDHVPARDLGAAIVWSLDGEMTSLWRHRPWYPWLLLPFWVGALFLVASPRATARRRAVGWLLLVLSGTLAVLEAFYLRADYAAFLPGDFGRAETFLAWVFVAGILVFRRRAFRRVEAVEAVVVSQALLAFVHCMTLPATEARGWVGILPLADVVDTVTTNFPLGFWVACLGLFLAALPAYVGAAGDQGRQTPSTRSS